MKRIFFCIITVVCIIALLAGCEASNANSSISEKYYSDEASEYSNFSNNSEINSTSLVPIDSENAIDNDTIEKFNDAINSIDYENDKILATVNGKPIYASRIAESMARLEFSINHNLSFYPEFTEQEIQDYKDKHLITEKECLDEHIKIEVVNQAAIESGVNFSDDEVYAEAKKDVDSLKLDSDFYEMTLNAYNMTEKEYINHYMKNAESNLLNNRHKEDYFGTLDPNEVTEENIEKNNQKYSDYVNTLIEQADIQYN